ncbi:MAG: hypothetical protein E7256_06715 [Lachnospiraceae bacterium]|nr:hypothetical protein [Lachnospiraceae bacterium]
MGARVKRRVDNKGRVLPPGISYRSDGRYQARYTLNGRRYVIYDTNLQQIKKKLIDAQYQIQNNMHNYNNSMILNDWFKKWLEVYKKKKIKEVTYNNYVQYWNWYVANALGLSMLKDIKRAQIVEFYNGLLYSTNPIGTGTLKIINNLIKSALDQAVYNDLLLKNPAENILKEVATPPEKERRALTKKEQEIFFGYVKQDVFFKKYLPLFTVIFGTGARIGEITALTWNDIDFENEVIRIDKTLHYLRKVNEDGHHYLITTPKTVKSIREIPMLIEVKEALLKQRQNQNLLGTKSEIVINGYSDFVFTTSRCKPYTPDGVNLEIKRVINSYNEHEKLNAVLHEREPELLELFSPHIIRHTFASRCFEEGLQPKTTQSILGHANLRTTMDVYTHCNQEALKKEMDLLNKLAIS